FATPAVLTRKLWVVHSRPLRIIAAYSRSSRESRPPLRPPVLPACSTRLGNVVVGTVTGILAEIVGVKDPGLLTRRNWIVLKAALSTPTKYPSVAVGSKLSTPRGANGPTEAVSRLANAVTVIGPAPRTDVFCTT